MNESDRIELAQDALQVLRDEIEDIYGYDDPGLLEDDFEQWPPFDGPPEPSF
jgi:hypothetical protein